MNTPRRAFTLIELLVVIIILAIIASISIPAFASMLKSSEAAMAESLLKSALRGGRDASLRSNGQADSAAVFFYEPGGRLSVVPCVHVGTLNDGTINEPLYRDVFVPIAAVEPVQLPKGWMVRGYAAPNTVTGDWYEPYDTIRYGTRLSNWVFPETGWFDQLRQNQGRFRQSFMVRFEGGTGILRTTPQDTALVLALPSLDECPSETGNDAWLDITKVDDWVKWVQRVLNAPRLGLVHVDHPGKRRLLGDESSDTVLVRPVSQLVLYDEYQLATALNMRVDPDSGCLYKAAPSDSVNIFPRYLDGLDPVKVDQWLNGDTDFSGGVRPSTHNTPDSPESKIFMIDRYTGGLRRVEVQP